MTSWHQSSVEVVMAVSSTTLAASESTHELSALRHGPFCEQWMMEAPLLSSICACQLVGRSSHGVPQLPVVDVESWQDDGLGFLWDTFVSSFAYSLYTMLSWGRLRCLEHSPA